MEMNQNDLSNIVKTYRNSRNEKLRKMAKRELRKADCFLCDREIGSQSFEPLGGGVACVQCCYDIGSDGG